MGISPTFPGHCKALGVRGCLLYSVISEHSAEQSSRIWSCYFAWCDVSLCQCKIVRCHSPNTRNAVILMHTDNVVGLVDVAQKLSQTMLLKVVLFYD